MFECDLKANANRVDLAKNAYKRMRTFRHPYILSWLEGQESETKLTIVTEAVRPLSHVLNEIEEWTDVERNLVSWGLYQVAVRQYCASNLNSRRLAIVDCSAIPTDRNTTRRVVVVVCVFSVLSE